MYGYRCRSVREVEGTLRLTAADISKALMKVLSIVAVFVVVETMFAVIFFRLNTHSLYIICSKSAKSYRKFTFN